MERRPTVCPLCGSKITKVTNAVTKNSYFKCSNDECCFVLGNHYTDAEHDLQGTKLTSKCIKCKENLTVVNGPYGLYARCFGCGCDTRPTTYNNRVYSRHVNAHRETVCEEIKELINSYNAKNIDDVNYDFDAYIASTSEQSTKKVLKDTKTSKDASVSKVLSFLKENISIGLNAEEISSGTYTKLNSVRTIIPSLRTLGLVKIVGFTRNISGNHTLCYQLTESPLPELRVYSKKDGYNTIPSFLKENKDKYGNIIRSKEILIRALKDNKINPVLFHVERGIYDGYKISDMENALMPPKKRQISKQSKKKVSTSRKSHASETKKEIVDILNSNLEKAWTVTDLEHSIVAGSSTIRKHLEALLADKRVKVVGLKNAGDKATLIPSYQLITSPLKKIRIVKDLRSYSTPYSYYNKKFRGKRIVSAHDIYNNLKNLSPVNLMVGKRFYIGYSVSDLKKITDNVKNTKVITNSKAISQLKKAEKCIKEGNVKSVKADSVVHVDSQAAVSNPIAKKKSMFSIFSSLFTKKEKVLK